jgi:hypothetical protein
VGGWQLNKPEIVKERRAANVGILDRVQGIPTECPLLLEVDIVDSDPPMRELRWRKKLGQDGEAAACDRLGVRCDFRGHRLLSPPTASICIAFPESEA